MSLELLHGDAWRQDRAQGSSQAVQAKPASNRVAMLPKIAAPDDRETPDREGGILPGQRVMALFLTSVANTQSVW